MSGITRSKAIALVVVLLVCVTVSFRHGTRSRATGAAIARSDRLQMGSLILHRCEIGRHDASTGATVPAYCTDYDVPEQWDVAGGRHITLKVVIVKSEAARSEADLVAFLDGGPGGAASEDYPAIAAAMAPLRQRHDILLLDQRGTGGSNPLSCPDIKPDESPPLNGDDRGLIASLQQVRQCLSQVRQHAEPQYYTTTDAIRDLEAVRQALGGVRLDLLGISYGTRVAQQYAARYPNAVRAMVLDSVVPNTLALGSEHARNLERELVAIFARCSADRDCSQSFGDSYATLYRVRDRLRERAPVIMLRDPTSFAPLQRSFTADDFAALVRLYSYSPLTSALLPLLLHEADQGNFAPLLGQKVLLADDLGSAISSGMELSVVCAEDADLLASRSEDERTLLGNDAVKRIMAACSIWPKGQRPSQFHEPLRSPLPTLLLAGEHDPVTPPAYAVELVRTLPQARVLTAPGQGHGVIGAGCMPKLIGEFVDALKPQMLDANCLRLLGETPFFTDYNGPSP